MKIFNNLYLAILVLILSIVIFSYTLYDFSLSKVSNNKTKVSIVIDRGSIDEVANVLYKKHLIRNKLAFNIYVRISGNKNLLAGSYTLSKNMNTKEIVKILNKGSNNPNYVSITFNEGINMRKIASIISKNTNNSVDDFYKVTSDKEYLTKLIDKYWFLTDAILDDNIYYPLEGYLYPNTYEIEKDSSIAEIVEKMLDETDKQLTNYQDDLEKSNLSIHKIITMASIIELEGVSQEERKGIAGVFYNRLRSSMNLGSDVTTYYGLKIDMGTRDLYAEEVNQCNNYNTRCATFKTLPISPIANCSKEAINAAINPDNNDYYYFVADKNKKIYFSKTQEEHNNIINKLKEEGLWYEY